MAITLNYEWQEFGRVTFYSSGSTYDTVAIEGRLTGQSTQYNYSTIELRWKNIGSWWRTTNGTVSFTGTFTDSGGCATYPDRIETGDVFYTIAKTVYHDNNGDATIYVGGQIKAYVGGANRTGTISNVTVYLPHINRYANITGAIDFNDEGNPYVTYNNPAGFRINARLEFGGSSISRDNIANTGDYAFELTTAERNLLRQKCTGTSMTVRYVIATCYTGTTEEAWSLADRTMTIVNGNPTFSVTYQDTNSTTTAITNNNQQIIQNNSTLQFNIASATALKYATLSSVTVNINGVIQTKPISSSTLAFNYGVVNVANNINAIVTLTDSRGLTTTTQVPLTILSWNTPTAIITLNRKSNYYTETDITVDANYSSLDSKNTITIQYRTKKTTTSTWSSWSSLSDNVTSTFNADNEYEWDVQVKVTDLLGNTTYNLSLGVGVPIMFIDRAKRSVGIDCFPTSDSSLEVNGVNVLDEINNRYLKPEEIFTSASGELGNITLTKSVANYKYIEVCYTCDGYYNSARFNNNFAPTWSFSTPMQYVNQYNNQFFYNSTYSVSGTSITFLNALNMYITYSGAIGNYGTDSYIRIYKVYGYKE